MLKPLLGSILDAVPLPAWKRLRPRQVATLYYHVISDEALPHVRHYRYKTPVQFEADVRAAARHSGFISHDEVQETLARDRPVATNRALFTFDDGFSQCLSHAAPILRRHGAPAIFFLTTDFLSNGSAGDELCVALCLDEVLRADADRLARALEFVESSPAIRQASSGQLAARRLTRARLPERHAESYLRDPASPDRERLISWLLGLRDSGYSAVRNLCDVLAVDAEQYLALRRPYLETPDVARLSDLGFTIGAHGCSHRRLQTLDPAEREKEIVNSCATIRDLTGATRVPFAFPYGGAGIDRNELADIRRRFDFVGIYFDTGSLDVLDGGIVSRLWSDEPTDGDLSSDLPRRLARAWWRKSRRGRS